MGQNRNRATGLGASQTTDPRLADIISALLRISDRDFSTPLEPSPRRDEVDAVMTGINFMADQLRASYDELDQRVEERTRELAEARDALQHLASSDHLTGLANRRAFETALRHRMDAFRRGEPAPCVIGLDLDRFKEINDTWGHHAGDLVIQVVSDRLRGTVRDGDLVARWGGDEFVLLLGGAVTEQDAMGLCDRLLDALDAPIDLGATRVTSGGSMGFALAEEGDTAERLMQRSDAAMYVAKTARDGIPRPYRTGMDAHHRV